MVKILLERDIKGKHVAEIVRRLRQLRVMAMQQPGYVGGETLHAMDDPNHYLVISSWETLDHWQNWHNHQERQKLQAELDGYLESPTTMRVYTY
jgi:heme-degrading monooxygenase HmoA